MKAHALTAALAMAISFSPLETSAMTLSPAAQAISQQSADQSLIDQIQYRRGGVRAVPGGAYRGPVRRSGGRGNGGAAAAAIIGLGVLGAIAASQAGPSSCWIERRRVVDDYGRYLGVQRVRVCR